MIFLQDSCHFQDFFGFDELDQVFFWKNLQGQAE